MLECAGKACSAVVAHVDRPARHDHAVMIGKFRHYVIVVAASGLCSAQGAAAAVGV